MSRPLRVLAAALTSLLASCGGCEPAARKTLGEQCELNSDCDTPLVCRLGACRKECVTARDCSPALDCVYDVQRLGACQLEREQHCVQSSECPTPLLCANMECVNECHETVDCPAGAQCVDMHCVDMSDEACVSSADCNPAGAVPVFICAVDMRCRAECLTDRDCRFDSRCTDGGLASYCVPSGSLDGGP